MKYIEVFNETDYNKSLEDGYRLATQEEAKYFHDNISPGFHTGLIGYLMIKEDFE